MERGNATQYLGPIWLLHSVVTTGQCPVNSISGLHSSAQTLLQEKLLEACSHGLGDRLHPKIIKLWMPSSSFTKWMLGAPLHPRAVERFFAVIMSEEFFPNVMLACDNPDIHNMQVNFHKAEEKSNNFSYWRKLNLIFHSIKTSLHRQDKSHKLL